MISDKWLPAWRDCNLGRFAFTQNSGLPWYQYYCDPGLRIDPNAALWEPVDDVNSFDYFLEPAQAVVPGTGKF